MSKELTDAWKAGKLKNGWYFCKVLIDNKNHVCPVFVSKNENDFEIGEVLVACDYNQFVELTEKVKELKRDIKVLTNNYKLLARGTIPRRPNCEKERYFKTLRKSVK
jgi:hypothetical protein